MSEGGLARMLRWWRGGSSSGLRTAGEAGGGVSSWHLWWVLAPDHPPIASVAATLTVLDPPTCDRLYFWALQATFAGQGRRHGAAHLGLQWNLRFPDNLAVNWGGYAEASDTGSILRGTPSPLASTPDDPNTRDYAWQPRRPYRLRISRGEHGWRGEVVDLVTGEGVVVRELLAGGDHLEAPVVWAEVFCRCDHPTTAVGWSDLEALGVDGARLPVRAVRTSFPTGGDCDNTSVELEGATLVQRTNAMRTRRPGELIAVPTLG